MRRPAFPSSGSRRRLLAAREGRAAPRSTSRPSSALKARAAGGVEMVVIGEELRPFERNVRSLVQQARAVAANFRQRPDGDAEQRRCSGRAGRRTKMTGTPAAAYRSTIGPSHRRR